MNRIFWMLLLALAVALPAAAEPAKTAAGPSGGLSALLVDALRGLSALLPRPEAPAAGTAAVSTIGIRGSESTTTLIAPYWKDDRSNDPAFTAEVAAYTAAHGLLQESRWDEAQQTLGAFLADHPKSDLAANARFGQAIAAAGAGRTGEAVDRCKAFVADFPDHPLRRDAERLTAALAGAQP